jgi:hypothetical protein
MAVTLRPTAELVALAWLATIPGITSSMVATILPAKSPTWATTGFLVAATAGGNSELYIPVHRSLVQVDAVCFTADSQRPPWGRVDQLAQVENELKPKVRQFITDLLKEQEAAKPQPALKPDVLPPADSFNG